MKPERSVELHRRAAMALDSFTPRERIRVHRSLDRLAASPLGLNLVGARKISAVEPLYIMRAAPGIRMIFRRTPGGILVEDVVRRATLDSFIGKAPSAGRICKLKDHGKKKARRLGLLKASRLKRVGGR